MHSRIMVQAHSHLAYAPRGVGLLYAVLWFEEERHVYGWFIGARNGDQLARYFMLQDYFSSRDTHLLCSSEDDVYGAWVERMPDGETQPSLPSPVPQALCHELNRLQDQFVRHWLFFDDDPAVTGEAEALHARELPVRHVNIRASRLDKLTTAPAVWRYDSPGAQINLLIYLSKRWPLDYEVPS